MDNSSVVAIDGHFLNRGLRAFAQARSNGAQFTPRARIDYRALKTVLLPETFKADPDRELPDTAQLNYYICYPLLPDDSQKMVMGAVKRWGTTNGYGFITDAEGKHDYFVHLSDIQMPGYKNLRSGEAVRFLPHKKPDGKLVAKNVIPQEEWNARSEMEGKRNAFHEMLEDEGYEVVACRPNMNDPSKKNKSVDMRITADISAGLNKGDQAVLLVGDADFGFLLSDLREDDIQVTLATFRGALDPDLANAAHLCGTKILFLDDVWDQIDHAGSDFDEPDNRD